MDWLLTPSVSDHLMRQGQWCFDQPLNYSMEPQHCEAGQSGRVSIGTKQVSWQSLSKSIIDDIRPFGWRQRQPFNYFLHSNVQCQPFGFGNQAAVESVPDLQRRQHGTCNPAFIEVRFPEYIGVTTNVKFTSRKVGQILIRRNWGRGIIRQWLFWK